MIKTLAFLLLLSYFYVTAHGTANCTDLTIPVTATAENLVPAFAPFTDSYQATYFFNLLTQRDGNSSALFAGTANITETVLISARYCTPTVQNANSGTVQILTHGLGFDKSYWNVTLVPGDYSYVDKALAAGYSTFTYDRLGVGKSSYADPYTIIQAPIQLSILIELTKMVQSGDAIGSTPKKLVHIGHSFGSILTNALAAVEPTLTDGIILTGYSNNFTFQGLFLPTTAHLARDNQPERFFNYSTGYITWADVYYNQYSFLYYSYFDPTLAVAAEATKWPFTVGELVTLAALTFDAPQYKGPVLYLAAQHDMIFCGFDCNDIIDGPYSVSKELFPAVSNFSVHIQPNAGHAINLHYNASGAYDVALDWLVANGL